jgi:hypothetical protein
MNTSFRRAGRIRAPVSLGPDGVGAVRCGPLVGYLVWMRTRT